ncbi:MAG: glycosyltransferase, partial [Pseudomonadota bacterium]
LAPGGTLLACIPNLQNWKFLQTVLTEGFRYDQEGLFDRTHLRWFALPNMIDMLRQAGVTPMAATPRHVLTQTQNGDSHAKFVSAMTPSLAGLGIDPEDFHRRTMPLQYVLRGTKDPLPKRRMLVQAMMLKPVGGVNDVRIGRPLSALRSMTGVETVASVRNFSFMERAPDVAKIMIWQRPVHQKHEAEKILKLMERGYVVVTEFDDHLMRWPAIEANDYLTIKGCHGVQTSTDYLAAIFREQMADQQRPIAVFPNSLLDLPEPQNFDNPKTLRVFFGALNREEDWAPIMPGLNQAIASLTDKAQLFFDVIHDRAFFEALETEHKVFTETCPYATYLDQLSQADIALLPLADTLFNRCKSDLKFIEAGGCGCAVLASDTLYNLTVKDGETGHLITKPEDFGTRLLAMVDDPEGAKSMGDAARAYVRSERMMASQVEARLDWYQELWDTRHETTPAIIDYLKSVIES